MTLPLAVQHEIVQRLKPLDPAKVILFGSYAKGTATEESDIDLAVVVPGGVARSVDERLLRKRPINIAMRPVNQEYAIDIKVYSTAEYDSLKKYNDLFLREIETTGEVLYAK
jgi:predicted nucleotidyltransferase